MADSIQHQGVLRMLIDEAGDKFDGCIQIEVDGHAGTVTLNSQSPTDPAVLSFTSTGGGLTISGTDNHVVRMDGSSGIQDSAWSIDDAGLLSGGPALQVSFGTEAITLVASTFPVIRIEAGGGGEQMDYMMGSILYNDATFSGSLQFPATFTTNQIWTLPDATGTLLLDTNVTAQSQLNGGQGLRLYDGANHFTLDSFGSAWGHDGSLDLDSLWRGSPTTGLATLTKSGTADWSLSTTTNVASYLTAGSVTPTMLLLATNPGLEDSSGLRVKVTGVVTRGASGIDVQDATTSVKGAASFSSTNFAVTSGAVSIKAAGVGNTELATGLAPQFATTTQTNTNYTVQATDHLVLVSTGNTTRTITLPLAANNIGRRIVIMKTDTGTGSITIARTSSDVINVRGNWGATSQSITNVQGAGAELIGQASGAWLVINTI